MPISFHFRDCIALLVTSLTHASGAIASAQTFTFYYPDPDPAAQLPLIAPAYYNAAIEFELNLK